MVNCKLSNCNNVGALDEWLSHRSAKPCTAVRIRQAPRNKRRIPLTANVAAGFSFLSANVSRLAVKQTVVQST